jgi:hypothetical protein
MIGSERGVREPLTNAGFVRAASYMASNCASWAGDSMIFPERMDEAMKLEPLRRFIQNMRERLDRIDPDAPPHTATPG